MKYSDWLTKKQTADALGVSTKTVEKFAADKDLHFVMTKNPVTGATIVKYHPRDVEKLRKKRMPDAAPFVLPKDGDAGELPARRAGPALLPAPNTSGQAIAKTLAEAIAQASAHILEGQAISVPIIHRLYLTRAEAANYAGLPQSEINLRIKTGELTAFRTGRGWRILRRDLERFYTRNPPNAAAEADAIAEAVTELGGEVRRITPIEGLGN